jgi:hypothetical protein
MVYGASLPVSPSLAMDEVVRKRLLRVFEVVAAVVPEPELEPPALEGGCDGTKGRLLARPGRCVSVGRHSSMQVSRGNVKFCAMGRLGSGMTGRLIGPS